MCRGVNIYVCLKHLVWRADAFGISFPHVKNDPAGSRNWHPRHFYTNPDSYPVYCVRDCCYDRVPVVLPTTIPGWELYAIPRSQARGTIWGYPTSVYARKAQGMSYLNLATNLMT